MIFKNFQKLFFMIITLIAITGLTACGSGGGDKNTPVPITEADMERDGTESNADADEDNDGYTNQEEIAVGTDPQNPNSTPSSGDEPLSSELQTAFERYNSIRVGAGLTVLNYRSSLENAAKSHKNHLGYIYDGYSILEGHYENYESPHYTGYDPSIRGGGPSWIYGVDRRSHMLQTKR